MTTGSVSTIIDYAAHALEALTRRYQACAEACKGTERAKSELASFLATREQWTVEALEHYRVDAHPIALDTHIRFAAGFPYSDDELVLPEHATLDELIDLARRTDTLLEQLSERIQVYAAARQLAEILQALEELVGGRRRQLAGALNELEGYEPSPKHSRES